MNKLNVFSNFSRQYWLKIVSLIILSIAIVQHGNAQQTKLTGATYQVRAKAMVKLWSSVSPKGGDMKYTAPYYWTKIFCKCGSG